MKINDLRVIITCALIIAFTVNGYSKIELPSIIGDNMVLQQQTSVKIWGKAKAETTINVRTTWSNESYTTKSDGYGKWLLSIVTPIAGGPYNIYITDGEELILKNILIGEVWFCSGQSNMEMPMKGFYYQPVTGANDVIAKANERTLIRMFTTDSKNGDWVRQFDKLPQSDCQGEWLNNSPENVANISATAYYFAQYLQNTLDIPVGIIVSSWGGSNVEAWMSREAISSFSEIDLSILSNNAKIEVPNRTPSVLFNAKINPLTNFTIKGFLWYQGESNIDNPDLYARLMPAFVKDLRTKWDIGEFPFYYVQIAPYKYGDENKTTAARMREVQDNSMKDIPNSGMVVTLDVGDLNIIHPADKQTVGKRLALWALAETYKRKGFGYAHPIYKSIEKIKNKIQIQFDNAPLGIAPMGVLLSGFEIAGEDKIYHPAKAIIDTKIRKLLVYSDEVSDPIAVRYAYKNYSEASIFSVSGIPVPPFRTDNW